MNGFTLSSGDTFTVLTAGNLVNHGHCAHRCSCRFAEPERCRQQSGALRRYTRRLQWRWQRQRWRLSHLAKGDWAPGLRRATTHCACLNYGTTNGGLRCAKSAAVPKPSSVCILLVKPIGFMMTLVQFRPNRGQQQTSSSRQFALGLTLPVLLLLASAAEASPYSDAVLADGPLAYYRLGETSGSVAANSSTNGAALDGTYLNFVQVALPHRRSASLARGPAIHQERSRSRDSSRTTSESAPPRTPMLKLRCPIITCSTYGRFDARSVGPPRRYASCQRE